MPTVSSLLSMKSRDVLPVLKLNWWKILLTSDHRIKKRKMRITFSIDNPLVILQFSLVFFFTFHCQSFEAPMKLVKLVCISHDPCFGSMTSCKFFLFIEFQLHLEGITNILPLICECSV